MSISMERAVCGQMDSTCKKTKCQVHCIERNLVEENIHCFVCKKEFKTFPVIYGNKHYCENCRHLCPRKWP